MVTAPAMLAARTDLSFLRSCRTFPTSVPLQSRNLTRLAPASQVVDSRAPTTAGLQAWIHHEGIVSS